MAYGIVLEFEGVDKKQYDAANEKLGARRMPIIVHTEEGRSVRDEADWQQLSRAAPVCWVHSLDRLLDQTTVYLHRDAIEIIKTEPDIDVVLMDIMMPEMDGLETMRAIRKIPKLKNLPIVAVTAKAMKGDRQRCLEAGAWDYLSKPVETQQLLSTLRAWLKP